MAEKRKFVLIDGNAIIHRAFHALPPLTNKKGELVNAVYGFSSTLLSANDAMHGHVDEHIARGARYISSETCCVKPYLDPMQRCKEALLGKESHAIRSRSLIPSS